MLFEQCFAGQPSVNARDMAASWRPSYGEWLGAQAAEGFDRTITGRYLEEKGIALAEMRAGDYDPDWSLRNNETMSPMERAFVLKGWMPPAPDHAHAMTEADWKASPWFRKEISFRPDMTATRAHIMAENFDRRRYRERLLARGNELYDDAEDMALGFGAGLLGSLPDPINLLPLGGGAAAGSGAATLGRKLLRGAKAGAVNGAVSTAVSDALVLPDLASRGEDADFVDLLLDTLAGCFLGGVFGTIGGAFGRHAAQRRKRAKAVPDASGEAAAARAGDAAVDAESLPTRNADNDLLRQGWTAGERRAVARAADLNLENMDDGRSAEVAALLESGVVERSQWELLLRILESGEDFQDVNFGKLSSDRKQAINAIRTEEGVSLLDGDDLILPANVVRKFYEKRVLMDRMSAEQVADLLLLVFHGEADFVSATRYPHIQAIVTLRRILSEMGFIGRNEKTGETVIKSVYREKTKSVGTRLGSMKGKNPSGTGGALTPHSVDDARASPFAAGRLSTVRSRGEKSIHTTTVSVNGTAPDISTAAEPPAPSRMTPEAARQAEAGALAGQDESLRQRLADVEKRGAVDAGETAARTEDGLAGVPDSEARKK